MAFWFARKSPDLASHSTGGKDGFALRDDYRDHRSVDGSFCRLAYGPVFVPVLGRPCRMLHAHQSPDDSGRRSCGRFGAKFSESVRSHSLSWNKDCLYSVVAWGNFYTLYLDGNERVFR